MNFLPLLAERLIGKPLLVHKDKALIVLAVLGERVGVDGVSLEGPEFELLLKPSANRLVGEPGGPVSSRTGRREYLYSQQDGVAFIPVVGSLVNRGAYVGASSGLISYEGLAYQITAASDDPQIRAIMLDINSPGGEASGAFSLYQTMREARQKKPMVAFVNDMAASAAYGLAAQAEEIVVSESSVVGSVGVVMVHLDQSEELKKRGRKPTLIFAGAHKVDGNSFEPLPDAVRADLQGEVDKFYDRFVASIAAGRGSKLTEADARATEAKTFIGQDAVDRRMADRIGSFTETLARYSRRNYGGWTMNNDPRVYTQAEVDELVMSARRAERADCEKAQAEAVATATKAATSRIGGILRCPEAEGRSGQAFVLALDTEMSPDAAAKVLAASPAVKEGVPPVAQRSAPHVGPDVQPKVDASHGWDSAIEKANRIAGHMPPTQAQRH